MNRKKAALQLSGNCPGCAGNVTLRWPIKNIYKTWSSHHGTAEMNPTGKHGVVGLLPGLAQWVGDPALLWAVV